MGDVLLETKRSKVMKTWWIIKTVTRRVTVVSYGWNIDSIWTEPDVMQHISWDSQRLIFSHIQASDDKKSGPWSYLWTYKYKYVSVLDCFHTSNILVCNHKYFDWTARGKCRCHVFVLMSKEMINWCFYQPISQTARASEVAWATWKAFKAISGTDGKKSCSLKNLEAGIRPTTCDDGKLFNAECTNESFGISPMSLENITSTFWPVQ